MKNSFMSRSSDVYNLWYDAVEYISYIVSSDKEMSSGKRCSAYLRLDSNDNICVPYNLVDGMRALARHTIQCIYDVFVGDAVFGSMELDVFDLSDEKFFNREEMMLDFVVDQDVACAHASIRKLNAISGFLSLFLIQQCVMYYSIVSGCKQSSADIFVQSLEVTDRDVDSGRVKSIMSGFGSSKTGISKAFSAVKQEVFSDPSRPRCWESISMLSEFCKI